MKYFGTDGIRGLANSELSPELAYRTARAVAYKLKDQADFIVLGTDTRQSRDMLKAAITTGVLSVGLDLVDLGIIPTPAVAYFARKLGAAAGIVVSASHNPGEFNGIKLFSSQGYKFTDEFEEDLEALIDSGVDYYPDGPGLGLVKRGIDSQEAYIDYLLGLVDLDLAGVKICLDCGNGASLTLAEELFTRAGAQVIAINTDFNGMDINDNSGSTNPGLVADLVLKEEADIGLAFDGDADRLIAVDERGRIMDGDHYLAALAYYMKKEGQLKGKTVVSTVMANLGLKKFLADQDLDLITTKVGDRYVLEAMREGGYNLGGEQSGHFLFLDDSTTGCGLLASLKLLEAASKLNMRISDLNDLMVSYPQVLVNAQVTNQTKNTYMDDEVVAGAIAQMEEEMDGRGRVLIRPSGTEPLVRVMLEGEDEDLLQAKCQELANLIEERLN